MKCGAKEKQMKYGIWQLCDLPFLGRLSWRVSVSAHRSLFILFNCPLNFHFLGKPRLGWTLRLFPTFWLLPTILQPLSIPLCISQGFL